jgi:hypothetical protein
MPECPTWNSELDDLSKQIFPTASHLSFPPVRLTRERGHRLPPDGETRVAPHLPHAQIVVLMTRES